MRATPSAPLRADVVYVAPSGRRCRWIPGCVRITSFSFFAYVDTPRRRGARGIGTDGFTLAPANYHLLKEVL